MRYQVQAQLSCITADGWQSSQQVPTLAVPLATSARNAAEIVADAVVLLRDSQTEITVHAVVLDRVTGTQKSFKIKRWQ